MSRESTLLVRGVLPLPLGGLVVVFGDVTEGDPVAGRYLLLPLADGLPTPKTIMGVEEVGAPGSGDAYTGLVVELDAGERAALASAGLLGCALKVVAR